MSTTLKFCRASFCVLVASIVLLGGCQQLPVPALTQSPLPSAAGTPDEVSPTPQPGTSQSQATDVPAPVPTPSAGFGSVTGVVLLDTTGKTPEQAVMYLGKLEVGDNNFPVVAVDRQTAPRGIPSPSTGRFVISDAAPGKYGLSFWSPDGNFLVKDPANPTYDLIITVEAGRTIDVGTLLVPPT